MRPWPTHHPSSTQLSHSSLFSFLPSSHTSGHLFTHDSPRTPASPFIAFANDFPGAPDASTNELRRHIGVIIASNVGNVGSKSSYQALTTISFLQIKDNGGEQASQYLCGNFFVVFHGQNITSNKLFFCIDGGATPSGGKLIVRNLWHGPQITTNPPLAICPLTQIL